MIAHGKNIKIFAGNSHPELAEEIAERIEEEWAEDFSLTAQ